MSRDYIFKLTLLLIAVIISLFTFAGLRSDEFIFVHDEFLVLSKEESRNLFFVRNSLDLGSANTVSLVVTFFDRVYYYFLYSLNLEVLVIQKILLLVKMLLLLFIPYYGFQRLSSLYLNEDSKFVSYIVSLWYSLNLYVGIIVNVGWASLTFLLSYSLAPLALYYFHKSVIEDSDVVAKLKTAIVIFLISFSIPIFPVFLMFLFLYTVLLMFLDSKDKQQILKRLILQLLIYLPFSLIYLFVLYDMFKLSGGSINELSGATYGLLRGGLLYQLLMWFSWAIYTPWKNKGIFTYSNYLKSIPVILSSFVVYGILLYRLVKKRATTYLSVFLILFVVFLLFAKGAQQPFGQVYELLINNVPLFSVFRSPDTKFGFGIVFVLAVLLLISSKELNKKVFIPLLFFVVLIQGYPLLSGVSIRGENSRNSVDRILSVSESYKVLTNFLNENTDPYGYIITLPSVSFGYYDLGEGEKHMGQDLLPKLTRLPYIYLSDYSGMPVLTYEKLRKAIKEKDVEQLKDFPVKYYVIRSDVRGSKVDAGLVEKLIKEFDLVFENDFFTVVENSAFPPLLDAQNISYEIVNPTEYIISLRNLDANSNLIYRQSFNEGWKLYPFRGNSIRDKVFYVFRKPLFDSQHEINSGYANSWALPSGYIENNLELVLRYSSQSIFYLSLLVSFSYLLIVNGVLIIRRK